MSSWYQRKYVLTLNIQFCHLCLWRSPYLIISTALDLTLLLTPYILDCQCGFCVTGIYISIQSARVFCHITPGESRMRVAVSCTGHSHIGPLCCKLWAETDIRGIVDSNSQTLCLAGDTVTSLTSEFSILSSVYFLYF